MRHIILFVGLLLGYTFIYAGLSHFGLPWFAGPAGSGG